MQLRIRPLPTAQPQRTVRRDAMRDAVQRSGDDITAEQQVAGTKALFERDETNHASRVLIKLPSGERAVKKN